MSAGETSPQGPDREFTKVLLYQVSLVISTASAANLDHSKRQLQHLVQTHQSPTTVATVFRQLLPRSSFATGSKTPCDELLSSQLQVLAHTLEYFDEFESAFRKLLEHHPKVSLIEFAKWVPDLLVAFVFLIRFESRAPTDQVKSYIHSRSFELLSVIKTRQFPANYNWQLVLECLLSTDNFPFIHKLLALLSSKAFKLNIDPISKFYQKILGMSFKQLLLEIGPEHLLPEKLLLLLLQIKPNEVDQSIALILLEVLVPNLQGLGTMFGRGAQLLPEANARGAQLQACFKEHDQKATVNWYAVFTHLQELLFDLMRRQTVPLAPLFTLLFLALDFKPGIIDFFLSFEWYFSLQLLYALHTMNPQEGGFDVCALKNITKCFEENVGPPSILQFVNIGKLELTVANRLPPQEFERDFATFPEYLLVAALTIVEKLQFLNQIIDRFFATLLDQDLAALNAVVAKFNELDQPLLLQKATLYLSQRPHLGAAITIVKAMSSVTGLLDTWLKHLSSNYAALAMKVAVELSHFGYDYQLVIDARTSRDLPEAERQASFSALADIVDEHAHMDYDKGPQPMLAIPTVFYLLEKLKTLNGLIDAERLKNLQLLLLTTYPRLINFGNGHDQAILANAQALPLFPPSVEQEMKSYYSKMYNKEVEIKEVVDMLIQFKLSDDPHKQDVFACMIHLLLDEYRFFSEYPLSALALTSLLFGALLEKDLITGTTLTVALNFIWELCNQPVDSHLFKFAVQLLYNFKLRLHEYPIYCKHLLECQLLHNHAKMYQIVKDALNGIPCGAATQPQPTTPQPTQEGPKYQLVGRVLVPGTPQETPSEQVKDKLLFYVNNMTGDNIKLNEIKELLKPQFSLWFATYLVEDRAQLEPNNHDMYALLVFSLENPQFYRWVISVTLKSVLALLTASSPGANDKTHLKNLGAWLGKLTLAHDTALLRDHLAVKYLLVEAYHLQLLPVVIPFVCKILDQAQHSKIFRPPNPWTEGILKVLAELYECADLKLNLKFEIEVLLNLFKLKISDVEPLTLIRSHNSQALPQLFGQEPVVLLAGDMGRLSVFDNQMPAHLQQQLAAQQQQVRQQQQWVAQQQQLRQQQQQLQQQYVQQPRQQVPQYDTLFSNLAGNTIFTQHANLRRAFQALLARAVRECAVPILNRVLEAVLTTTHALVAKDFATEGDPQKLRKAYQTMAQQLTHAMVLCLGRKLLAETIEATMIQLMGTTNPQDFPAAELNQAIQANVGLCVEIVAKIALDNTVELIDERMHQMVAAREEYQQKHRGEPYADEGVAEYAFLLPAPLGLPREGILALQMAIYEQFGFVKDPQAAAAAAAATSAVPSVPGAVPPSAASGAPLAAPAPVVAPVVPELAAAVPEDSFDQLFGAITQGCDKAIALLAETQETKLVDLPVTHPIMGALTQALTVAQSNALKFPELLLKAAQYAVNCLFTQTHENPMATEIYVVILDKLCEYSPLTAKDVTWWLVHLSDQRKFNVPVIYLLLKVQLVAPSKLDALIGKLITETKLSVVVKFAADLLLELFGGDCPEDERPVALRLEFALTIKALKEYDGDDADAVQKRDAILERLLTKMNPFLGSDMYTQLGYVFVEWNKLVNHPQHTPALKREFITQLVSQGILTNPKALVTLVRAALDISMTLFAFEHEIRVRTLHEQYLAIDALAVLMVELSLIDKSHAVDFFTKMMAVVVQDFVASHEAEAAAGGASTSSTTTLLTPWNERAFFRLFSSILSTWADALIYDADATAAIDADFYTYIGDVLVGLQPIIFPGFTFAWISLIAHRMLLPKLLELEDAKGYPVVVKFLTAVMKFQTVYAKDFNHDITLVIFKAISRILIGIAHDYPEFLVECHYQLVLGLPRGFVQLRNIILSAAPKLVTMPDPFTLGLKVERLAGINDAPVVNYKPMEDLIKVGLKKPVETYLRIPAPTLMRNIYAGIKLNHPKDVHDMGTHEVVHYNIKLINALVLHVGILAVTEKLPLLSSRFNPKSSQVALLVDLMNFGLDEFKFHMVNAIANQLRYPNCHTHWFIGIILYFFLSSQSWLSPEVKLEIQEIITRVLLERRIAAKPHPWGLTIVFTELIKNEDFGFFELPFVKLASPELKSIFDALAVNVKGSTNKEPETVS